jgi:hypothetical protein
VPVDQIIEGGAQIRITKNGFQKLSAAIPGFINQAVSGICIPKGSVIGVDYCDNGCGGGQGCPVEPHIDSITMSAPNDSTFNVHTQFDVHVPVHIDAGIIGSCTLNVDLQNAKIDVNIGFGIDPATGELTVHLTGINVFDISGTQIGGCGLVGSIINAVAGVITDFLSGPLGNLIIGFLTPVIDSFVQGLLPDPLGVEGILDVGQFLAGIAPGVEAHMEVKGVPGGYVSLANQGLSIGMIVGLNSDRDTSSRDPATDSQAALCVPDRPPPDFSNILEKSTRNTFKLDPAGEFLAEATPDPAYDLVAGVSETVLDLAGHHAVSSGAMCLGVSTTLVPQLNLGTIGILVPSLSDLGNGTGKEPLLLVLRPQTPVDFTIGAGTMEDPRLTVHIRDLEVDFYAFLFERYVRGFTVSLTLDLGLNLDFTIDDMGRPAIEPQLLGLESDAIMVKVHNAEFLAEDAAQLEAVFPTLFDLVVPLLGDALGTIAIPDLQGFTLSNLEITKVVTNEDDFLAIYASLAPSMATKQQWEASKPFLPAVAEKAEPEKPAEPIDTRARLVRLTTPRPEAIRSALMARNTQGLPSIELDLATDAPRGTPVEWSWRMDGGLWHVWSSDPHPVLQERAFALQGKHVIEVRSRVQGDYRTFDRTPVEIPVTIDSVPPRLLLDRAQVRGDEVVFVASDLVYDAGELTWAFAAVGDDTQPAWRQSGTVDADELATLGGEARVVRVLVKDGSGNVSDNEVALDSLVGFHGRVPAGDGGCGCTTGKKSGGAAGGALVLLVGAVVPFALRRRGVRRALEALAIVAIFSLPACDCSGAPDGGGECAVDEDCAAQCGAGKIGVCEDGTCSCIPDIPVGNIGMHSDLAVSSDGSSWVSAYNKTHGDLMVAQVQSPGRIARDAWEFVDGVPDGPVVLPQSDVRGGIRAPGDDVGFYTAVAVSADGSPMVAYYDATNASLKFAGRYGGVWVIHTVDEGVPLVPEIGGEEAGRYATMILAGPDARPAVGYLATVAEGANMRTELRFAFAKVPQPSTATDWSLFIVETQAVPPLMEGEEPPNDLPEATALFVASAKLADGTPLLAWYDRINGDLKLAKFDLANNIWLTPEVVDGAGDHDVGWYPSIAVDASDVVHLAYLDAEHDNLLYVNTTDKVVEVVDDGYRIDGQTADGLDKPVYHLVGDDSGIVVVGATLAVAYQDATSHELLMAVRDGATGQWKHETIAGAEDPFAGGYGFYAAADPQGGDVVMSCYAIDNLEADYWVEVFRQPAVIE